MVYRVVMQRDVDARVVTALPWVVQRRGGLDWGWLRDKVKVGNAQNRLGYLVRLAREGTLCRESMRERERAWWRKHRPEGAAHWNLLTGLSAEEMGYAG